MNDPERNDVALSGESKDISYGELFSREEMLIGSEGLEKLSRSCVAVFGLGGVGGSCAEALARAGIGKIILVDCDRFSPSNLNRQVLATRETIGGYKAKTAAKHIGDINPFCEAVPLEIFFGEETKDAVPWDSVDFICDCIDSVSSKILLAKIAEERGIGIISSMGTGNKLDPCAFRIDDIYKTSVCPLARSMRGLLKKEGVKKLTVVYSTEQPVKTGTRTPGSISFVPPVAGMIIASYVVRSILGINTGKNS